MARTEDTEKKEQKRKSIMQAALKIFARKGYSPAAIDEVAQEAGIAKGTLYLYFKDKEDLFYNTMMLVLDDMKQLIVRRVSKDLGPVEMLQRTALALLEYFSENDEFFNIYMTILNYHLMSNVRRLFESMMERKRELFEFEMELVEKAKKEGLIRNDLCTEDIVICFDGIVMNIVEQNYYSGRTGHFDPAEKTEAVMKLFLEGAGSRRNT
jgi:TetR/AcrR family fatty acid metabolism transcriptional regulator